MMKKIVLQAVLSVMISVTAVSILAGGTERPLLTMMPGFYLGLGGAWNTMKLDNSSYIANATTATNYDTFYYNDFKLTQNKFSPVVNAGYWGKININYLWGLGANYKWIDFNTQGAEVRLRNSPGGNFSSVDTIGSELLLLGYLGKQLERSFAYFGLGASMFSVTDKIINRGNNPGLGFQRVVQNIVINGSKIAWGWVVQLGYNYFLTPNLFFSMNYTYAESGKLNFNAVSTRANLLPVDPDNPSGSIGLNRKISIAVQEIMLSINKILF